VCSSDLILGGFAVGLILLVTMALRRATMSH
jgi:hypothetical protein